MPTLLASPSSLALSIALSSAVLTSTILVTNPATLSIFLILATCTISLSISIPTSNWFALTLFLIYAGGMLVIFSYFVVIQPNQHLRIKGMLITLTRTTPLFLFATLLPSKIPHPSSLTPTLPPFYLLLPPHISTLIILALALLLSLVAVVKISLPHHGPLRPFH